MAALIITIKNNNKFKFTYKQMQEINKLLIV